MLLNKYRKSLVIKKTLEGILVEKTGGPNIFGLKFAILYVSKRGRIITMTDKSQTRIQTTL